MLALTHRSKGSKNYERLEFLGDSILGFVIADWLYHAYPHVAEGKLSRMRASLVRKETLAKVAREMQLSDYLILGEGELKSGGFNRDSILADVVESLIGAIYLDSDFDRAAQFILSKFEPFLELLCDQANFKDAKSQLQELMQKKGMQLPVYQILQTTGEQHQQMFTVQCKLAELGLKQKASAGSRRLAEQKAAEVLLEQLST
ncbi:MAG: ribonuclease III [Arenicella sp.]|nr:ribonuclease III [Arenicella sp.]